MKSILFLAIFALAGYISSCFNDRLGNAAWLVFIVLFGVGMYGLSRMEEKIDDAKDKFDKLNK